MAVVVAAVTAVGEWFGGLNLLGQALVKIGASLLLSAASRALMPSPDQGLQGRTVTVREPVMPRDMVYGQARKGGTIVFMQSGVGSGGTVDEDLHLVIVLAAHQVHAIGGIYFNGELAADFYGTAVGRYSGWLEVHKTLGGANQPAFARLMQYFPAQWTAAHQLKGCAAIYLRLVANPDVYPQGIPNITVDMFGKNDVLDPRSGLTGYSENAALCLADYMAHPTYGLGAAIGAADGIDSASLIAAANICDEVVAAVGGGTERRYSCNGVITLAQTPKTIIEALLTAMAGTCGWQAGNWHIYAGAYRIPSVAFTGDDVAGGGLTLATRLSRSSNCNAVRGQFVSPQNDWQPDDFPSYESAVYLAEDGGERVFRDISLPFTISASMAQRLAKIELERTRRQMSVEMTGKLSAWRATVGDTVDLSYARWGFAAKPFEVRSVSLALSGEGADQQFLPQIALQETSPLVYDWTASEAKIYAAAPRTTLPSAFNIVAPGGLSVTESLYQTTPGTGVKAKATLTWTASTSAGIAQYQVEASLNMAGWQVLGRTDQTSFDYLDIQPGQWEFQVKAISQLGVSSSWAYSACEIFGLGAAPVALTGVTLQSAGGLAVIEWALHPDLDVRIGGTIEIRHSSAAVPIWANSVSMKTVPGGGALAVVPLKDGTYILRARDAAGNYGPDTIISSDGIQAIGFAVITTLQEDITFTGTKTDCFVTAGALRLAAGGVIDTWPDFDAVVNFDNEGGILPVGTYNFAAGINFGSVKKVRLRSEIDLYIDWVTDLIDDRVGNIDDWVSFDGAEGGDVDVVVEVRTSPNDPSGSPTWGAWGRVDSTELQAWGVQARAILSTTDATYTPVVTQLRLVAAEAVTGGGIEAP